MVADGRELERPVNYALLRIKPDADAPTDPRTRPYYVRAKQARRLVWSPPDVFYDQAVPGITCANPLIDRGGQLRGVLTVDFDLRRPPDGKVEIGNTIRDLQHRLENGVEIAEHADEFGCRLRADARQSREGFDEARDGLDQGRHVVGEA